MDFIRNFVHPETSDYLAGIYVGKGQNAEAVKQLELYLKAAPNSKETEQIKNLIKELNKKPCASKRG